MGIFGEKNYSVIRINHSRDSDDFTHSYEIECGFEAEADKRMKEIFKILKGKKKDDFVKLGRIIIRVGDICYIRVI